VANAENNNSLAANSLTVSRALVGPGPVLKRFKAGARGSAKPRVKRMSHLRIVLTDGKSN
jgi:large subunit ribosomal protein L22